MNAQYLVKLCLGVILIALGLVSAGPFSLLWIIAITAMVIVQGSGSKCGSCGVWAGMVAAPALIIPSLFFNSGLGFVTGAILGPVALLIIGSIDE